MKNYQKLVRAAVRVELASTPLDRMKSLYRLHEVLERVDPLEMYISVENALSDLEPRIAEADKDSMRELGYQFPEDFDEPKKMFCD